MFDKLVAKLVFGGSYAKHADATCSATTIRKRRDEWIASGILDKLEQIVLTAYDQIVGLDLADVTVDSQITKAPCGGEAAGPSRNDSPLLRPTHSSATCATYGYSKERRVDPQIVIGLLIDRRGFPLEIGCFEGNKAETLTMTPIIKQFQERHDIADMVVVADAGML